MSEMYAAAMSALLFENVIFSTAYGVDAASSCFGLAKSAYLYAYTFVITVISGAIYFIFAPLLGEGLYFAKPFLFAGLVFILSLLAALIIKKLLPAHYNKFRSVASNASIYGMTIGIVLSASDVFSETDYGFAAGVMNVILLSASAVITLYATSLIFSTVSQRCQPKTFRGLPTFYIASGLISMVFCSIAQQL